jgi:hypothetical protein
LLEKQKRKSARKGEIVRRIITVDTQFRGFPFPDETRPIALPEEITVDEARLLIAINIGQAENVLSLYLINAKGEG